MVNIVFFTYMSKRLILKLKKYQSVKSANNTDILGEEVVVGEL